MDPSLAALRRRIAMDLSLGLLRTASRLAPKPAFENIPRYAFLPRLVSGDDDRFIAERISTVDRLWFRWFRFGVYRRNLAMFRRDYRYSEKRALAGMDGNAITFGRIFELRLTIWRDLARLDLAGVRYLAGFPVDVSGLVEHLTRTAAEGLRMPISSTAPAGL